MWYSDSVENGSIIFSLTAVTFLLMDAKECLISAKEIFLAKTGNFINIHQNSFYVSVCCPPWAQGMETNVRDSAEVPG